MNLINKIKKDKPVSKNPVICIIEDTERHTFSTYIAPKYGESPYIKTMLNRIIDQLNDYVGAE